jgi:phosphoheptose isomerase
MIFQTLYGTSVHADHFSAELSNSIFFKRTRIPSAVVYDTGVIASIIFNA